MRQKAMKHLLSFTPINLCRVRVLIHTYQNVVDFNQSATATLLLRDRNSNYLGKSNIEYICDDYTCASS